MSFIISLIMPFVMLFLIILICKIKKKYTHNNYSDGGSVKFNNFLMNIMLIFSITVFIIFLITVFIIFLFLIKTVIDDSENTYDSKNSYSYNGENSYDSNESILKSNKYTVSDLDLTIEKITTSDGRDIRGSSQDELNYMSENGEIFTVKFSERDVLDEIIVKRSDMYVKAGPSPYAGINRETYGAKKFDNMLKTYSDNGQVKVTLNDGPVNDEVSNLHFKLEDMDAQSSLRTYFFKDNRVEFN